MGKKEDIKEAVGWLTILNKFLGFLQAFFPALLMAWVNHETKKANKTQTKLDHANHRIDVMKSQDKIRTEDKGKTTDEKIDDMLNDDDSIVSSDSE
jgi:preprotein translocase subunit SecG